MYELGRPATSNGMPEICSVSPACTSKEVFSHASLSLSFSQHPSKRTIIRPQYPMVPISRRGVASTKSTRREAKCIAPFFTERGVGSSEEPERGGKVLVCERSSCGSGATGAFGAAGGADTLRSVEVRAAREWRSA